MNKPAVNNPALNGLADIVDRAMTAGEIPGAVVLVAQHGEVQWLDARGTVDLPPHTPLRTDSVFAFASMTKPVVAAAALALWEDGQLGLDDPVERYIPEFAAPRQVRTLRPGSKLPPPTPPWAPRWEGPAPEYDLAPSKRPLLLRDFLSHTSGLQTIFVPNDAIPAVEADDTLATWVPKLAHAPLEFQPGTRWHYSNATGFEVVARVVEVASGMPFGDYVQSRLFAPLGMQTLGFGVRPEVADRCIPLGPLALTPIVNPGFQSGSAGLFGDVTDYWRFPQMLLAGGMGPHGRVLQEATVRTMSSPQIGDVGVPGMTVKEYAAPEPVANPGMSFGFGVGIVADGPRSGAVVPTGAYGWDGVGTRRFWVIPSLDAVLVMLMPGMGGMADEAHRQIEQEVVRVLGA